MYSDAILAVSVGVVAGVLSGVSDGISNGIRKTLKGVDRNTVLQYQFATGSLFALLIVVLSKQEVLIQASLVPIIATGVFAILQIGLGNLLLYGFQNFDVNIGTIIVASELFFATILGYLFFRESTTTQEFAGGVLIFSASILSAVDFKELTSSISRRRKITS